MIGKIGVTICPRYVGITRAMRVSYAGYTRFNGVVIDRPTILLTPLSAICNGTNPKNYNNNHNNNDNNEK